MPYDSETILKFTLEKFPANFKSYLELIQLLVENKPNKEGMIRAL